jgi:hypothetical protein
MDIFYHIYLINTKVVPPRYPLPVVFETYLKIFEVPHFVVYAVSPHTLKMRSLPYFLDGYLHLF